MRYLPLLLLLLSSGLSAQLVDSDCSVLPELAEAYERDVKGLAVKRMQALGSPDQSEVIIPQSWQDTIMEGLAAIYNATSFPQRDSVFNQYCVHDNFSSPMVQGLIVGVNVDSSWVQAWIDGNTLTGFAPLDEILMEYELELQSFSPGIGFAVLNTDQLLNMLALGELLAANVPGIQYGEPNYVIGLAGRIQYELIDGDRFYNFIYEWNDCFDGCDNYYSWRYRVTPDCQVEFLGSQTSGVFMLEPLPAPTNCNISVSTEDRLLPQQVEVFPNPASAHVRIQVDNPHRLTARLFDSFGRRILDQSLESNTEIMTEDLSAGIYWLRIANEEGQSKTLKVVIQ